MDTEIIRLRSKTNRIVREFFESRNFLEVETPLLSPDLIPEVNIEIFRSLYRNPCRGETEMYLVPSPEIWMKKLLSRGSGSIFQICRSFRNSEQVGLNHNPEFSMLEWYETDIDYRGSMETTRELLSRLAGIGGDFPFKGPFRELSMEEAFRDLTGEEIRPWCRPGPEGIGLLWESARRLGHQPDEKDTWEEIFNLLFLHHVETELPDDMPLFLTDYPANIPCLAARSKNGPWYERWELYINGIEIANCYTEETDPLLIRSFCNSQSPLKTQKIGGTVCPVLHKADPEFARFFHKDFPRCSGVALGLDRLIMLLGNKNNLGGVILFPFPDIVNQVPDKIGKE